jgi:hypothetical protein
VGLIVSVAGNVGHIQPLPGHPVLLADRLTAAASPLAAFAGLTVGLLVLRMNRQRTGTDPQPCAVEHGHQLSAVPEHGNGLRPALAPWVAGPAAGAAQDRAQQPIPGAVADGCADASLSTGGESPLLQDAVFIYRTAAARGERLTQRDLARTLRGRGHRFPNQNLRAIAVAIGLGRPAQQLPADGLRS